MRNQFSLSLTPVLANFPIRSSLQYWSLFLDYLLVTHLGKLIWPLSGNCISASPGAGKQGEPWTFPQIKLEKFAKDGEQRPHLSLQWASIAGEIKIFFNF